MAGYSIDPGWAIFAWSIYQGMLWVVNDEGIVHGEGRGGISYGPDAPLEAWLADQVADLAYLRDNEEDLSWAGQVLDG